MNIAFEAKIVFRSKRYGDLGEDNEISLRRITETINMGKVKISMIENFLSSKVEPVIILTDISDEMS